MGSLEKEATDAGVSRGWDHASIVDAYGGVMIPEESDIEVPEEYLQVPTYYTLGYLEGIEQYENEYARDDDEFVDPREPGWNGC